MLTILFSAAPKDWPAYASRLPAALATAGLAARVVTETDAPEGVDYIVYAPSGGLRDFTPFTRARGVLSLWLKSNSLSILFNSAAGMKKITQ